MPLVITPTQITYRIGDVVTIAVTAPSTLDPLSPLGIYYVSDGTITPLVSGNTDANGLVTFSGFVIGGDAVIGPVPRVNEQLYAQDGSFNQELSAFFDVIAAAVAVASRPGPRMGLGLGLGL